MSTSKTKIFPTTTLVESVPSTICQSMDSAVFTYPFFNEGVNALSPAQSAYFKLEDLETTGTDLLEVKGFIFHTSHCGSTLLSRMLNVSPEVRIVSETEAINGLLLSYLLYDLPEDFTTAKLQRIIDAYRQPLGNERYLILKMSSWNIFMKPLIDRIYPDARWIYIDRNTEEVVRSLMKSDGGMQSWWDHPVDNLRKYFVGENNVFTNKEVYLERLIQKHRASANQYRNDALLPLLYPDFISQFASKILPHFELNFSEAELNSARDTLAYHSKSMKKERYTKT